VHIPGGRVIPEGTISCILGKETPGMGLWVNREVKYCFFAQSPVFQFIINYLSYHSTLYSVILTD